MDAERRLVRSLASASAGATEAFAARLGAALPEGAVVALTGELGAGKTTFVRGLARGLGIEERVTSPTFTLMHVYEGARTLHHFDAWMEGRERAFLADGGAEALGEAGVAAIEWAERVADWLPRPHLALELTHRGESERGIALSVVGSGPRVEALAELVRRLALPPGIAEEGGGAARETP